MVAPLSSSQLAVLAMGGAGGFLRMGVRKINGLENVSSYTGWAVQTPESNGDFEEAMGLLQELERAGLIDFTVNIAFIEASSPFDDIDNLRALPEGDQIGMEFRRNEEGQWVAYFGTKAPHLRFAAAAGDDPRALRLRDLLNLAPDQHTFPLVDVDFSKTEKARLMARLPAAALDPEAQFTEVVLNNRSMLEILLYASKSVRVPEEHLEAGLVEREREALSGLLTIWNSPTEPEGAAVRVQCEGTWFYIAADDPGSKQTLVRLNVLFATTAGRVAGSKPLLTIPAR